MPSWKKIIQSGSDAELSSLLIDNDITLYGVVHESGILSGSSQVEFFSITNNPFFLAGGTNLTVDQTFYTEDDIQVTSAEILVDGNTVWHQGNLDKIWSLNGSDAYYNGGDVVIGKNTADYTMHVYGSSNANLGVEANSGEASLTIDSSAVGNHSRTVFLQATNRWEIGIGANSTDSFYIGHGTDFANKYLTVLNTGNIGIGETDPDTKLHVDGTISGSTLDIDDAVRFRGLTDQTDGYFVTADSNGNLDRIATDQITVDYDTQVTDPPDTFWENNGTEIYYDGGNVGINVSGDPDAKFHVKASNTRGIFLEDSSVSAASPWLEVWGKRSDGNQSPSFAGKLFLASSRTSADITQGKALGVVAFGGSIDYTDTGTRQTAASIMGEAAEAFGGATMGTDLVFLAGSTPRNINTPNVDFGTERMRISSTGNVGIGDFSSLTETPVALLHVKGEISGSTLDIKSTAKIGGLTDQIDGYYVTADADGNLDRIATDQIAITYSQISDPFWVEGATAGEIYYNGGNIGIGTDDPAVQLHLDKANDPTIRLTQTGEDSSGLQFSNVLTNQARIQKYNEDATNTLLDIEVIPSDSTKNALIRFNRTTNTTGTTGIQILEGDGTSDINTQIAGQGDTYIARYNGDVSIGHATPAVKFDVSGSVRFRDITNDNSLDNILVEDADGDIFYRSRSTLNAGYGVISGSDQIAELGAGIISGSQQVKENLPSGTVSGSDQVFVSAGGLNDWPSQYTTSWTTFAAISVFNEGSVSSNKYTPGVSGYYSLLMSIRAEAGEEVDVRFMKNTSTEIQYFGGCGNTWNGLIYYVNVTAEDTIHAEVRGVGKSVYASGSFIISKIG